MGNHSTYEQLVRLKNGDIASLESIYFQYHSIIYHYSLRFIQDEAMAKEATADVFITLWKKRTYIDINKPIQAFLYKIAKDIAYDYLKKIASNQRLKEKYFEVYGNQQYRDGEELLMEKEQLAFLEQIVDDMPPKRSQIFKLRYFEGLDNKKIALQMGISIHTVKVHLAKARSHLKKQLASLQGLSSWIFFL